MGEIIPSVGEREDIILGIFPIHVLREDVCQIAIHIDGRVWIISSETPIVVCEEEE